MGPRSHLRADLTGAGADQVHRDHNESGDEGEARV